MIYLIKVEYKDVTLLKVGYAKDIKKRLNQYTTENPLFELLDYREGDRKLEDFLHSMFKEYKFEKGKEWFYYNEFIVNNFHSDFEESILIEKIKKKMNRSKSFSSKLRLYCEFKERYPEINFKIDNLQVYLGVLGIDRCRELGYREFLLYKELCDSGYFNDIKLADEDEAILSDFLNNNFYKTNVFHEKMKLYCEFSDKYSDRPEIIWSLVHRVENPIYLKYYRYYGTSGCSARKFREHDLYQGWKDASKKDKLSFVIYEKFNSGDRLPMVSIKSMLKDIYSTLNISKSAKATDLSEYFKLSKTQVTTPEGVKNGFKLGDRLK